MMVFTMRIAETVEHFVTPNSMLYISGHDAFRALVSFLSYDLSDRRNFLDLVVFGFVLADIWRVGLAGVCQSPGFSALSHKARRLITRYLIAASIGTTQLELLTLSVETGA